MVLQVNNLINLRDKQVLRQSLNCCGNSSVVKQEETADCLEPQSKSKKGERKKRIKHRIYTKHCSRCLIHGIMEFSLLTLTELFSYLFKTLRGQLCFHSSHSILPCLLLYSSTILQAYQLPLFPGNQKIFPSWWFCIYCFLCL